jgi:predicted DNA-binding protein with PD1-like motif
MKSKLLNAEGGQTFVLVLDSGEEVMDKLRSFAHEKKLQAAHFTAIGALRKAVIGFFDFQIRNYQEIRIDEQTEVLSILGDITCGPDNKPRIHAHTVLGKADGTAHGGHLLEGWVHPTLELILQQSPTYLIRKPDADTGLPLIQL